MLRALTRRRTRRCVRGADVKRLSIIFTLTEPLWLTANAAVVTVRISVDITCRHVSI